MNKQKISNIINTVVDMEEENARPARAIAEKLSQHYEKMTPEHLIYEITNLKDEIINVIIYSCKALDQINKLNR